MIAARPNVGSHDIAKELNIHHQATLKKQATQKARRLYVTRIEAKEFARPYLCLQNSADKWRYF